MSNLQLEQRIDILECKIEEQAKEIELLRERNALLKRAIASMADKWVAQNWDQKAFADELDAAALKESE